MKKLVHRLIDCSTDLKVLLLVGLFFLFHHEIFVWWIWISSFAMISTSFVFIGQFIQRNWIFFWWGFFFLFTNSKCHSIHGGMTLWWGTTPSISCYGTHGWSFKSKRELHVWKMKCHVWEMRELHVWEMRELHVWEMGVRMQTKNTWMIANKQCTHEIFEKKLFQAHELHTSLIIHFKNEYWYIWKVKKLLDESINNWKIF